MKHIIIDIRYSLLMMDKKGKNNWKIGRNTTDEDYKKMLFDPSRMLSREKVFGDFTLKSLQNIFKNLPRGITLKVHLITSIDLPAENKNFLQSIEQDNSFIEVKYYDKASASITRDFEEYIKKNVKPMEMYASVRLDDDDMLSIHWLQRICSLLNPLYNNKVISLSGGYAFLLDNNMKVHKIADFVWRCPSAGLTYIGQKDKSDCKSIYQCGAHNNIDERFVVFLDSTEKYLARIYSDNNDSNDKFPMHSKIDKKLDDISNIFYS